MDFKALEKDPDFGSPSGFSCPECGGVLWELHEHKLIRFRCRTGHAYSLGSIQEEQLEALENALWVALKVLNESASLSRRLAKSAEERGQEWLARSFNEKVQVTEKRASVIRDFLIKESIASDDVQDRSETAKNDTHPI